MDITIFKNQNKLLTFDNDLICIKPLGKRDYTTYPIDNIEECLKLTIEEFVALYIGYYEFNDELNGLTIREVQDEQNENICDE